MPADGSEEEEEDAPRGEVHTIIIAALCGHLSGEEEGKRPCIHDMDPKQQSSNAATVERKQKKDVYVIAKSKTHMVFEKLELYVTIE